MAHLGTCVQADHTGESGPRSFKRACSGFGRITTPAGHFGGTKTSKAEFNFIAVQPQLARGVPWS
jgi:hypothetical protein